jgi:hypothetical protein
MAVSSYQELAAHAGHRVVVVTYGDGDNAAVECEDCSEVLVNFDRAAAAGEDSPVYLALVNTDALGDGYVVRFDSEAAYQRWDESLGDNEEPFGFQGAWGLATAILDPERALAVIGTGAYRIVEEDGHLTVYSPQGGLVGEAEDREQAELLIQAAVEADAEVDFHQAQRDQTGTARDYSDV